MSGIEIGGAIPVFLREIHGAILGRRNLKTTPKRSAADLFLLMILILLLILPD
jgi:hypothetical protein